MTDSYETRIARCAWCGGEIAPPGGPGRPRRFCKRSHRQRHFEARRAAARLGLGTDDVLVSRSDLDRLRDKLFVLEAALEDVERDLGESSKLQDYADAYVHLLEGALPLRGARVEPRALGGDE
ncbi:MAG TPA: hypothetical protein VGC47_03970 [Acidimicrobiia bacterium]